MAAGCGCLYLWYVLRAPLTNSQIPGVHKYTRCMLFYQALGIVLFCPRVRRRGRAESRGRGRGREKEEHAVYDGDCTDDNEPSLCSTYEGCAGHRHVECREGLPGDLLWSHGKFWVAFSPRQHLEHSKQYGSTTRELSILVVLLGRCRMCCCKRRFYRSRHFTLPPSPSCFAMASGVSLCSLGTRTPFLSFWNQPREG